MEIKILDINTSLRRVALLGVGLLLIGVLLLCAKWSFANMASQRAESVEIAALTARLAPDDPQTHYAAAVVLERTFDQQDLERAIVEYETATALSPNNYLLWLALGRARERAGDADGAEKAVRRAFDLAPHYSVVHWTLGNILLRQGKPDEAFAEIRTAVAGDSNYADAAVAISWQMLEGNLDEVRIAIGDSPAATSALVLHLARAKNFDSAVEVLYAVPPDEHKTVFETVGDELHALLVQAKKYRSALRIQPMVQGGSEHAYLGEITNPGFERLIKLQNAGTFEWQIAPGMHPQIVLSDGQKRTGAHSLWLIFNSTDGKEFRQVSQMAASEAGRTYELEMFYKSELKTAATMKWEIVDASTATLLGATDPLEAEADWSPLKARFSVPPASEAVMIRLVRDGCRSAICPISGRVWFDDFSLRAL